MNDTFREAVIAVDVGNQRAKLGMYSRPPNPGSTTPQRVLHLPHEAPLEALAAWLENAASTSLAWFIGSVNRPATTRLVDWVRRNRPEDRIVLLTCADVPLEVRLPEPDMVGIDRLLDAVAADRLRSPESAAVVVDVGTAITVDLVSADGAFLGGSILPGFAMSARALHQFTDLLPLIDTATFQDAPPVVGHCTEAAMRSGLFWGTVGAVRELVDRFGRETGSVSTVFLTGGTAQLLTTALGESARLVPDLTLCGIAWTAMRLNAT